MTQKQRILDLLSDHQYHSMRELNAICYRYGGRLHDLRQEGHVFEEKHTGSYWEYRLKPAVYVEQDLPMEVRQ